MESMICEGYSGRCCSQFCPWVLNPKGSSLSINKLGYSAPMLETEEWSLPLVHPIIERKLRAQRIRTEPATSTPHESLFRVLPTNNLGFLEEINKAKKKVQRRYKKLKSMQVFSLEDAIESNKSFQRQLKLSLYRSGNPELIAVVSPKKQSFIPKASKNRAQSSPKEILEYLKRMAEPKWKYLTRQRLTESCNLKDFDMSNPRNAVYDVCKSSYRSNQKTHGRLPFY